MLSDIEIINSSTMKEIRERPEDTESMMTNSMLTESILQKRNLNS